MTEIPEENSSEDLAEFHCRISNYYNGYGYFQPVGFIDPDWSKIYCKVEVQVSINRNLNNNPVNFVLSHYILMISL